MTKLTPENFAEKFELEESALVPTIQCLPITIWVPIPHKQKYETLQAKTKSKFGKFLKEVVTKTIDKVAA